MNYHCSTCNLSFESNKSLANHKYNAHCDLVTVTLDDETVSVSRVNGKFTCPKCSKKLISPTTLKRHLEKRRDGHCTGSPIRKKRLYSEVDSSDNSNNNNNDNSNNNDNTFNADDSNNSNDDAQSIILSQHQMQTSRLNIDEHSSSSSSITNSFVCDKKTSILLASSALSLPDSEQEKRILLANVGDWEPVMLSSLSGKTYHFLTSLENIQDVLVDQPYRYAVSQLFAGAILIEQSSAILLNSVEPYGRLKSTDAHYERRIATAIHLSSYPEKESKYGWITVIKVQEDNTTKLKIGTTTFNLLATSSLRLGKSSSLSIQIGSNTSHIAPAQSTSIYLDVASIKLANLLIENESATSINQETYLYQLRQVRSKFYCLSTYTRCRSFSSIARNIAFRPYTIWTLYEYDTPQKTNSQAKMLSSIFQTIACSVIRNGSSARVNVNCFKNVKDQLKDNVTKSTLAQILELEEDGFIAIINNFKLNSLLQPLADSISTSIKNANLNAAKQFEMSLKA
ncbi:unnamed protein product [Rhizopus stolonifer]